MGSGATMLNVSLAQFAPDFWDIQFRTVTTVNGFTKVANLDHTRAFIFISSFPAPVFTNPQLRIGGGDANNPVIAVDTTIQIRESWWTIGAAVSKELWLGGMAAGISLNVTEILFILKRRSTSGKISRVIDELQSRIARDIHSTSRRNIGNGKRSGQRGKAMFVHHK